MKCDTGAEHSEKNKIELSGEYQTPGFKFLRIVISLLAGMPAGAWAAGAAPGEPWAGRPGAQPGRATRDLPAPAGALREGGGEFRAARQGPGPAQPGGPWRPSRLRAGLPTSGARADGASASPPGP